MRDTPPLLAWHVRHNRAPQEHVLAITTQIEPVPRRSRASGEPACVTDSWRAHNIARPEKCDEITPHRMSSREIASEVVSKETTMYANILIPTDGSELAAKAVQHGIALASRLGAKVTVLTVLPPFHPFTTNSRMIEDTPAQYKARMQEHAGEILGTVARAEQEARVACDLSVSSMSILPGDH
jgi:Universal stress protein family